jgi:hypothetical protein
MPGRRALLAAVAALAWLGPLAAQEVYKSVDGQGHIVYSDRGSNKSSVTTPVRVQESDPAGAAQLAKEQRALEAADAARKKEQAAEDKQHAAQAKQRQQACDRARQEYDRVLNTRRLYHLDADGNRIYYSDTELDQERERAHRAVVASCRG